MRASALLPPSRCCAGDSGQRLACLDLIADGDEKFHHSVDGRGQRVLHLHRLDRDHDGARRHPPPSATPTATTVPGMG